MGCRTGTVSGHVAISCLTGAFRQYGGQGKDYKSLRSLELREWDEHLTFTLIKEGAV
jgi:hypothetical protein